MLTNRVSSIRHAAFVVNNIDKSLEFYQGILGLEVYLRLKEEGEFIEKLTGIKGVVLEWAKLIIPNGGLIELLQYHSHPDKLNIYRKGAPSNKMGASHVALTVNGLEDIYQELIEGGFSAKSEILITPNGKAKILYVHDPDGSILELIEDK